MADHEMYDVEICVGDQDVIGTATFRVDAEYDYGSGDADGRAASPSGWCVDATLTAFKTDDAVLSREQMIALSGTDRVQILENQAGLDWLQSEGLE